MSRPIGIEDLETLSPLSPDLPHPERVREAQVLIMNRPGGHQLAIVAAMLGFLSQHVEKDVWDNAITMIEAQL